MPGFNLRALNCCLTLKFGVCIGSYVQEAKIKKKNSKRISKTTRKSNFWKNFRNFFSSQKCPPFGQKSIFWALVFFANILIFIVLIDSTKKTLGYRRSCGDTFENFEFFRFLRGPNGGFPKKFQKKISQKSV